MDNTMKGKTLVPGHTLIFEGDALGRSRGLSGPGEGGCSCGARSPRLETRAARKRWHKEHKDAIRAALPANPNPDTGEKQ